MGPPTGTRLRHNPENTRNPGDEARNKRQNDIKRRVLVLSSLGEQEQLIVLRDGRQLELSDIPYGDNGDYILKRFFGLNEVRNPQVQREIDYISAELSKEHPDFNEIERMLDALNAKGVQFEESAKMRLLLAQKKKKAHEKD